MQEALRGRTRRWVVIDNKYDGFLVSHLRTPVVNRQLKLKDCAAGRVCGPQTAAVRLDDGAANRESNPDPFIPGCKESREQLLRVAGRESRARVLNGHHGAIGTVPFGSNEQFARP